MEKVKTRKEDEQSAEKATYKVRYLYSEGGTSATFVIYHEQLSGDFVRAVMNDLARSVETQMAKLEPNAKWRFHMLLNTPWYDFPMPSKSSRRAALVGRIRKSIADGFKWSHHLPDGEIHERAVNPTVSFRGGGVDQLLLGDVLRHTEKELRAVKGMGYKLRKIFRHILKEQGLRLGMDQQGWVAHRRSEWKPDFSE